MLPFAVDYHPYTSYHISESLQILLFTALAFFVMVKMGKLHAHAGINIDLDWIYRVGGRVFLWLARKPVQLTDNFVSELYRLAGLLPLMFTARASGKFDNKVIDGAVDGLAETVRGIGSRLRFVQRGQMQENLAFAFAVAAALMVIFLFAYNAFAR
jgi:multicomponent Na+:H+ antiporter subunit D